MKDWQEFTTIVQKSATGKLWDPVCITQTNFKLLEKATESGCSQKFFGCKAIKSDQPGVSEVYLLIGAEDNFAYSSALNSMLSNLGQLVTRTAFSKSLNSIIDESYSPTETVISSTAPPPFYVVLESFVYSIAEVSDLIFREKLENLLSRRFPVSQQKKLFTVVQLENDINDLMVISHDKKVPAFLFTFNLDNIFKELRRYNLRLTKIRSLSKFKSDRNIKIMIDQQGRILGLESDEAENFEEIFELEKTNFDITSKSKFTLHDLLNKESKHYPVFQGILSQIESYKPDYSEEEFAGQKKYDTQPKVANGVKAFSWESMNLDQSAELSTILLDDIVVLTMNVSFNPKEFKHSKSMKARVFQHDTEEEQDTPGAKAKVKKVIKNKLLKFASITKDLASTNATVLSTFEPGFSSVCTQLTVGQREEETDHEELSPRAVDGRRPG